MRVCYCRNVSDARIREARAEGHRDLDALSRCLGVGTGCGRCRDYIRDLIAYWDAEERNSAAA
jgi:bacterioferritin-associated ferredoxin